MATLPLLTETEFTPVPYLEMSIDLYFAGAVTSEMLITSTDLSAADVTNRRLVAAS